MVRQDFPPHRIICCVMLEREGKVMLTRRANTGWADGTYVLPGGHLEAGETPMQTALREVQEECGVTVAPDDIRLVHVNYRNFKNGCTVAFIFHATQWQGEVTNGEPDKCDHWGWFSPQDLPHPTLIMDKVAIEAGTAAAIRCSHYLE